MIKSVITTSSWYYDGTEEMLIPIRIEEVSDGYNSRERLNRMLPEGHRYHGYEG